MNIKKNSNKSGFLENITQKKIIFEEWIEEAKNNNNLIVFYGASAAAKKFYKIFEENNIKIDFVIVSDEYFQENSYFYNHKIYSFSDFYNHKINFILKFDMFVFFGTNNQLMSKILKIEKLNNVRLIDGGTCYFDNVYTYEHLIDNEKLYESTYGMLEDEISKETMIEFFNSRISGNAEYIRPYGTGTGYFPAEIVDLKDNMTYIDCGAYDGDTIDSFIISMDNAHKKYKKIYGFEPSEKPFKKLKKYIQDKTDIEIYKIGVWSKKDKLGFSFEERGGGVVSKEFKSSEFIQVDAIDNVVENLKDEKVMIKMDLEGSEMMALKGAEKLIKKTKPILAISVYHKIEDLIQIPKYLRKLVPEYKFYLRALLHDSIDVTLFAILKEGGN